MGTSLLGFLEIRLSSNHSWRVMDNLNFFFLSQNYPLYGLLFGVRNQAGFIPIAPNRGIPNDASKEVQECTAIFQDDPQTQDCSWISWQELSEIQWDAIPVEIVREYDKTDDENELEYLGYFIGNDDRWHFSDSQWASLKKLGVLERSGNVYKLDTGTARDAIDPSWEELFNRMKQLSSFYRAENVRMVIWFHT